MLSVPVSAYQSGRQGEPRTNLFGILGGKLQGGLGGIFTPHFEPRTRTSSVRDKLREIVAGPPADLPAEVSTQAGPSQFRSPACRRQGYFQTDTASWEMQTYNDWIFGQGAGHIKVQTFYKLVRKAKTNSYHGTFEGIFGKFRK